jgi:hypothetical protein
MEPVPAHSFPADAAPVAVPAHVNAPATAAPPPAESVKLAIIIQDVSPEVPDEKVDVFSAYLGGELDQPHVEIIDRAIVANAVSSLAREGANRGTGDPKNTEVDRLLSDQATALSLGRTLGADGLVVATITSLVEDVRDFNDPQIGIAMKNVITTLGATWKVIDGTTGGSLASGNVEAINQVRQTPNLKRSPASPDHLLRDASKQIAPAVMAAMRVPDRRPLPPAAAEVGVRIWIEMQDLSVPEVIKIDGQWTIAANRYHLIPLKCNVMVDGILAGSAPGVVPMLPGFHKISIDRPGFETVSRPFAAKEGSELMVPMQLHKEGLERWREQTRFFEGLKAGAVLRDNEQKLVEALAEFMKNSSVTIDTSQLQNLSLWQRLLY